MEQDRKDKEEEAQKKYFSDRIGQLQRSGTLPPEEADKMRKWSVDTLKYHFERLDDEAKKKLADETILRKHREDKSMDAAFKSRDQSLDMIKAYKDDNSEEGKAIRAAAMEEYKAASKIIKAGPQTAAGPTDPATRFPTK